MADALPSLATLIADANPRVRLEAVRALGRQNSARAAELALGVMDRTMDSAFAKDLLASFREAFGVVWVKDVKSGEGDLTNILVTNWPAGGSARWNGSGSPYRDDRNTADRDHVNLVWNSD